MPRLSVYFIRASFAYLLVGFTFGGLILSNKGIPFMPMAWALLPAHIEFMMLGWMTQLALGMAFWIFPRLSGKKPRGNELWSWGAFGLVNGGIILSVITPLWGFAGQALVARFIQAAGLLVFAIGNWPRIYPLKFPNYQK